MVNPVDQVTGHKYLYKTKNWGAKMKTRPIRKANERAGHVGPRGGGISLYINISDNNPMAVLEVFSNFHYSNQTEPLKIHPLTCSCSLKSWIFW